LEDTADVVLADLDESLITPGWAPRVLDKEVVLTTFGTIADSEDTVIERSTATGSSKDTTLVLLEGGLISFNGDGDGTLVKGSLKLSGRAVGNIVIGGSSDDTL
jgi:hypothetical protein